MARGAAAVMRWAAVDITIFATRTAVARSTSTRRTRGCSAFLDILAAGAVSVATIVEEEQRRGLLIKVELIRSIEL
eukprot:SAG31_NODE_19357_length_605_cov_0.545455_1_plen_75_part_10